MLLICDSFWRFLTNLIMSQIRRTLVTVDQFVNPKTKSCETGKAMTTNSGTPAMVLHNIPHYQQRFHWDCGVTCVLMLLENNDRQQLLDNFAEICREEGFGQSTWTIDLCYLLKRFGVPHTMYTTMVGVNEDHKKQNYYSKIITLDRERVQRRFAQASANGIKVVPRGVSQDELLQHLQRGPAILLVDAGLLSCDLCKHNKMRFEFRRWFGGGYRGHYIVCVGARGPLLLYRDPARRPAGGPAGGSLPAGSLPGGSPACGARAARLLAAHAASGTDRDAILIHRDYR
ncbi:protein GUCD1 isoform X2 [Amyelois transitella]|uniref:protein GUCD1 isoform X2 n=1 Tax=Amyelois transitella TaxID=680683 RepID=UPI00298FC5B6|nr:protein GUCD1 isoform X2 [Amyelois transitella]